MLVDSFWVRLASLAFVWVVLGSLGLALGIFGPLCVRFFLLGSIGMVEVWLDRFVLGYIINNMMELLITK